MFLLTALNYKWQTLNSFDLQLSNNHAYSQVMIISSRRSSPQWSISQEHIGFHHDITTLVRQGCYFLLKCKAQKATE
jgi:hypothetical protein